MSMLEKAAPGNWNQGGKVDDEEELQEGSQSTQADQWLTDEQYASGKWYRFAVERLLPMILSTRLTTAMIEFLARSGFMMYVPVKVFVLKMVNANILSEDPEALLLVLHSDGTPIMLKGGRPLVKQGRDPIPAYLAAALRQVNGTWYSPSLFFNKVLEAMKHWSFVKNLFPKGDLEDWERDEITVRFIIDGREKSVRINKDYLQEIRMWVPTPILDKSLLQAPRYPFDMVPKHKIDALFEKELQFKISRDFVKAVAERNRAILAGQPHEFLENELVPYQYCGTEIDEELIRAYRTKSLPRVAKLPLKYRRLVQAGYKLWDYDPKDPARKKIRIVRWIENEASITLRAHRAVADEFITAEQVYNGLEETKNAVGFDPDPAKLVPPFFYQFWSRDQIEQAAKNRLVDLVKTDPIGAASKQRIIREYFEDWVQEHYDRKIPCEQYRYKEWFGDLHEIYGNDWASRADRWFNMMKLRVFMKSPPGVYSSTAQWANFLQMELFMGSFEDWRNLQHMQDHWKYSKAMINLTGAMEADERAPNSMRQNDWGGIWNPIPAGKDWRFDKLDTIAPKSKPRKRMRLLGPAWFDKEPWQDMDHDGSLIDKFGQKKINWLKEQREKKSLSSSAGTFTFPKRKNQELEKTLAGFRDYDSEYKLLLLDEYFARDPVDVIENQKGIVIFSVLDDVNVRIKARYAKYPGFYLTYDNCCQGARFVERMWKLQPADPIIKGIEGSMRRWKRENIRHFRVEINRLLEGVYINKDLRQALERWYRESDERYWEYVYYDSEMMSTMTEPGSAYGFGINDASKAIEAGFGMGYGPIEMWQYRQEGLMETALYTGYFSTIKGVLEWWSVRVDAVKLTDEKSWPSLNELKMKIAGLLDSRKLIYVVAEMVLWPQLKIRKLLPSDDPFPFRMEAVKMIDNSFVFSVLNERAGSDFIPSREMAELDPRVDKVRTELIEKNQGRFNRLAAGRFHEINVA